MQFDPLSLPAGIENFTYNGSIDEENALAPLRATGRPDGNVASAAMRRSLFGSRHVHSLRTDCGSSSVIGAQPQSHGTYGSGNPLRRQPLRLRGGAFGATSGRSGDHPGARALQSDRLEGGCSLQVRSQLHSPLRNFAETAIGRSQVHHVLPTYRTGATATKCKVGQWSDKQMHAAIVAVERGAKV